jgi:hypothetical protein
MSSSTQSKWKAPSASTRGHLPRHVARSHWYRRNRQKGGQGTGQNIAPYTTRTHIPLYPSSVHPDHQDSLLYI